MQLDGVTGGSKVTGHEDWIELNNYDWDLANSTNLHKADSEGAGTVTVARKYGTGSKSFC